MGFEPTNAQCVYTESQAFKMKIPTAYHEPPTTKFRLFWDVNNWNFPNIKTYDAFRNLLLLTGLSPFSQLIQVNIVKSQKYDSVFFFLAECRRILDFKRLNLACDHLGKWSKPGALCQKKYRILYMNFHYVNLMKSMKKRVRQVKVKG